MGAYSKGDYSQKNLTSNRVVFKGMQIFVYTLLLLLPSTKRQRYSWQGTGTGEKSP